MTLKDLNAAQKSELKQNLLSERIGNPQYGELVSADETIDERELEERYGNTVFTDDDFLCP